jgi:hypothetical protein
MTTIFFSYSHKDEALRNELEAHLALLKHEGLVESWHDRRIVAGEELDEAIFSQLETANIILLLVSSDFMSSNYCYSREMTRAMERHYAQEAKVIPIILRHCDWNNAPFGKLMAVPRDAKPVTSWPDRDEAFTDVAKQIRQAVEGLRTSTVPSKSSNPISIASYNAKALPRSSNLRLKQEFSELDVDQFVRSSFDFICRFFEGSVNAVNTRNPDVTGTFELIDSRRMVAILYRSGKKLTECSVRLDVRGRSNGIAFSYDSSASSNSFNEMLMPEAGDQSLHLKSMGMAWGSGRDKQMSQEGASEFLWELFIKQAQS